MPDAIARNQLLFIAVLSSVCAAIASRMAATIPFNPNHTLRMAVATPNIIKARIRKGIILVSVSTVAAMRLIDTCSDFICASLCVIDLLRSYHACAICFTISTPSGLVNALAHKLALRSIMA